MDYSNRFFQFLPINPDLENSICGSLKPEIPKPKFRDNTFRAEWAMKPVEITEADQKAWEKSGMAIKIKLAYENTIREMMGLHPVVRLPEEEVIDHQS
jgi:hypothetical protein